MLWRAYRANSGTYKPSIPGSERDYRQIIDVRRRSPHSHRVLGFSDMEVNQSKEGDFNEEQP
jgi:hypothetical protein